MLKKQTKVIFLLIIMVVLTGCSAEYNLNISDDKIIESTNFYVEDDDLVSTNDLFSSLDEMANYYYLQDYDAFYSDTLNNTFYEKNLISDNDKIGLNLTHTYSFTEFNGSYLLNYKYTDMKYEVSKNDITIDISDFSSFYKKNVGDEFNNSNFNSLIINIKTDLKVLDNNADNVNGNVYTWNIDKKNALNKKLYIKLRKNNSNNDIISFFVIFLVLTLLVIALIFHIIKKKKENNEI